jgi:hypothetical protein
MPRWRAACRARSTSRCCSIRPNSHSRDDLRPRLAVERANDSGRDLSDRTSKLLRGKLQVRELTGPEVATIAGSRYQGPYATYDPDRIGQGHGNRFVAAILQFALKRYDGQRVRLFVLEWNQRSSKVAARLGFAIESVVHSDEGPFLVMVRHERGTDPP